MHTYPPSLEEKLGFDLIRDRLGELILSEDGRLLWENLQPSTDLGWIGGRLEHIAAFQEALRFDDPIPMAGFEPIEGILKQLRPEGAYVNPEELRAIGSLLGILRRVQNYFETRKEKYPGLANRVAPVVAHPDIETRIQSAIEDDGSIRDDASDALRELRRQMARRQGRLRGALLDALKRAVNEGFATESQPTLRHGRMVIPVRAEAKRKVDGVVHDVSATGQTVYVEPAECLELNNELRGLEAEERREIVRILQEIASQIRPEITSIRDGAVILAQLDVLHASAQLSNTLDAIAPQLNAEGIVRIINGRNPSLILHFLQSSDEEGAREVIPLNLKLGEDYSTLVITGPNAGGKTVAMKTLGLFAMMIAYGLPIPADAGTAWSPFEKLMVDIGDEQSIEKDLSTFSSHLTHLRYVLENANQRSLVLMDESGGGTDPIEGAALAQAALERLTLLKARTVVTTHASALKAYAHETEGVENGSMQFDPTSLEPTYMFQSGVPGSSYAFEIAGRIGLPKDMLTRARDLSGRQSARLEELILDLETREKALRVELQKAEEEARSAEAARSKYELLRGEFLATRDQLQEKALVEAEQVVKEANARIERTIREIKENQAEQAATRKARQDLDAFKDKLTVKSKKVEKRRKPKKKKPSAGKTPLQVGDQVALDDGHSAAELVEIDGKEGVILTGSMHMRVKLSRLRKVGGPKKQKVQIRRVAGSDGTALSSTTAQQRIDLRGQRVEAAMPMVMRLLDEGIAARLNKVEILHGKGTGALKSAIHEYLDSRPDVVRYEEAPWNEGGAGVTYVVIGGS